MMCEAALKPESDIMPKFIPVKRHHPSPQTFTEGKHQVSHAERLGHTLEGQAHFSFSVACL